MLWSIVTNKGYFYNIFLFCDGIKMSLQYRSLCYCSCSKFLSQILKIVVKNFSEMVPGKQTQKEGFRPLIFLTHSMRITLLIIIEFDPCIYAVKFNFIPFQVPLYQAADVIQNHT